MASTSNTFVAIMAGGIGSRFWPASRTARPKQFLDIMGVGKSLIQLTYERFLHLCPPENIYIVTNGMYKDLVLEHLPDLQPHQVLCEPSRNNTAPCIAYAAYKLQALNPEAQMVVAPSDHLITNEQAFLGNLQEALDFSAAHDALLTLGIQPTRPDTGYGYIQYEAAAVTGNVHRVARFTEKPPLEKAREYLASGNYLWNAGIFIWKAKDVIAALQQHARGICDILGASPEVYNTSNEQAFIDAHYPQTPNISIDYAIMEKAGNVFTVPGTFGWSDLGTWASLHSEAEKDENQNLVQADHALLTNTSNCLIRTAGGKLVVITDLNDYIVVDEDQILLIHPKYKEQEIKKLTQQITKELGSDWI